MSNKKKISVFQKRDTELQQWLAVVCDEIDEVLAANEPAHDVITKLLWAELFRARAKSYRIMRGVKNFKSFRDWTCEVIVSRRDEINDTLNFCEKYLHVFDLNAVYFNIWK